MLKHTKLLKNLLEKSLRTDKDFAVSKIGPGQECIIDVRPWELRRTTSKRKPVNCK